MDDTLAQLSYSVDTFYFLICGALVMLMAAGFSMLEAGLVRAKNTTEILTKNIALFAISCTLYLLAGYSIMYASEPGGWLPSFSFDFLGPENSLSQVASGDKYYSARADFFFQVVFVATAMSIISGAVAERMKLWAFLIFSVVMSGFIYPTQGYWSWGGGALSEAGFMDFAGSGIVHLCGAAAALAGVLILGPRKGKFSESGQVNAIPGANMPLATIGAFLLWFGWFGFNGGSQLKLSTFDDANAVAAVFVNTNAAASGGVIAAILVSVALFKKIDLTMALNGALAGLVAITAEPLAPSAQLATLIGAIGGALVVFSIIGLDKLRIDDPVGAISVHGVVGVWGVLAVCISQSEASLGTQLMGIGVIFTWTFLVSLAFWLLIKQVVGIRVSAEDEYTGLDVVDCGVEAYPEFVTAK